MTTASEERDIKFREYVQTIQDYCALANKPEKASNFIKRGLTPSQAAGELLGNRIDLVADMKRRTADPFAPFVPNQKVDI